MEINWKVPTNKPGQFEVKLGSFIKVKKDDIYIIGNIGLYSGCIYTDKHNSTVLDIGCGCCAISHEIVGYIEPDDLTAEESIYLLKNIGKQI